MYTIRINAYRNMEFILRGGGGVGGARDLEVCMAKEHAPLGTLVVQKFVQISAVVSFVERLSSCRRFKMH